MAVPGASGQAASAKGRSRGSTASLLGALLAAGVLVASFFLGLQYFTAKRATVVIACAAGLAQDKVTLYRLPSGILDRYAADEGTSPLVDAPLAPGLTLIGADKKRLRLEDLSIAPGSEQALRLTLNPKGQVCRIEVLAGFSKAEGSATVKSGRELLVDKASYSVSGTLMLSSGAVLANSGDDLTGVVDTGDIVRVMAVGGEAAVLEVLTKAGKVSVSSNVEGASVFVDGTLRGKTPCVVTASPGLRQVSVRAQGYVDKTIPVEVASLSEVKVSADLEVATGSLSVSSVPAGAQVWANGEAKGTTPARLLLIPGAYEIKVELQGYYPRTFRVTVVRDKEQSLQATLVKKPADQNSSGYGGASGTQQFKFSLSGAVLARKGDLLYIGDGWTECRAVPEVVIQDSMGRPYEGELRSGDIVTVYGDSASALRVIRVDAKNPGVTTLEGNLVAADSGYLLFGDESIARLSVPADLEVVDEGSKSSDLVAEVPPGSRVRIQLGPSGKSCWAEYVWRAGASADGVIASISGAALKVLPSLDDMYISLSTAVFRDGRKAAFFDLRVGDSVLAAGPFSDDIRFVWVKKSSPLLVELYAVVLPQASKEGVALQEYKGGSLVGYRLSAPPSLQLVLLGSPETITAGELRYGDRVRVWLDQNRKICLGEVLLRNEQRMTGTFLGQDAGLYYMNGFQGYMPSSELIIAGLAPGETLEPGSKVLIAAADGKLSYVEVQSEVRTKAEVSGTILSTRGSLLMKSEWLRTFSYGKDSWFVDWTLRQDGPISTLFPGDKVVVSIGLTGEAAFVRRTYTPPFRLEGTLEAISDNVLVVSDKAGKKTVTLSTSVTVVKGGRIASVWDLALGDKVKVSGKDKASVDVVVVE